MPLEVTSTKGLPLEAIIKQGNSVHISAEIQLGKNYEIEDMHQTISSLPSKVQAWTNPNMLSNEINIKHIENTTITILVDSETQTGNYTLAIMGSGTIKDLVTGNYLQLNNNTLGTIHLTIQPNPSKIRMNVGTPEMHQENFCAKDPHGFTMCNSLVTYEEFSLTVYSKNTVDMKLNASIVPTGSWLRIIPQQIVANSNGSSAKIIMSGIEKPPLVNPLVTNVMTIQAASTNGDMVTSFLPIVKTQNLTILNFPAPIELAGEIGPNINSTNYGVFGVVYDPHYNSTSLPVNLSVLGLIKKDNIIPLPSWLDVNISKPSFDLNATQPYYFMITVNTPSAPAGNYTVAIKENIGEKQFIKNMRITLASPVFMGSISDNKIQNENTADPLSSLPHMPSNIMSPLMQFKSGISVKDITCKKDFTLILKSEDNFPACVKPKDVTNLVQRGWAKLL
ncbi:hypothetical protein [Candidatus Nitrosotalea okcheonensis]|nr:hypothetical protein [Candidatus Nitrosotalea okcheonensis]